MSSTNRFTKRKCFFSKYEKRRGRRRSFLSGVAVLTKAALPHSDPRPLRLLLLSVPLVREAGETKKEVRWALDLSARVFRALMHCWKCQSSEDWWRDYKTLFVPNLPCHCWRSWCVRANEAFLLLPLGCCGDGKHFFFLAVFMDGRV